jgi:N4-gp56 family major capsid protein
MADVSTNYGTGSSDTVLMAQSTPYAKTANIDKTVTALVKREILDNLRPTARWLVPGAYLPGKLIPGTNLIRHIAYGDLSTTDPVVLVEGEPPDEEPLTLDYEEYGVKQRVRIVAVTDVALALNPNELLGIAAEKVAFDALMTVDRTVAAAITSETPGAAGPVPLALTGATVTAADVRKWAALLKVKNIPTFPDGYYRAMVNPAVVYDLQGDTAMGGWLEAQKYASPENLLTGEIGRMYGIRFIETTVGTSTAGSPDTYTTVVFGPDYFAWGDLMSIETFMVRPGGDHSDPAGQKALVGYKGMWGGRAIIVPTAGGARYGMVKAHAGTDLT